ncbi:MAG: hypothetical protein ACRD1L_13155, partial [Terriglobales bacterium]
LGALALVAALGMWRAVGAQAAPAAQYTKMAPTQQYLLERGAEIALARSAAPEAISRDAQVLVLGPHGYETAVPGRNGFVCMVERGWLAGFGSPVFWNPKIHGPDCLNRAAARSIVPIAEMKTKLVLEGKSEEEIVAAMRAAFASKTLPGLETGAMGYMMSKAAYLTNAGGNLSHLMVFLPLTDAGAWGAGTPSLPAAASPYWFSAGGARSQLQGLPPLMVFVVGVPTWSDGSRTN